MHWFTTGNLLWKQINLIQYFMKEVVGEKSGTQCLPCMDFVNSQGPPGIELGVGIQNFMEDGTIQRNKAGITTN